MRQKDSPGSAVPVGAELAAEHGLPDVAPLDLVHDRAELRLAAELEQEPRVGLRPDHQVEPRGRGLAGGGPELQPPALEDDGPGLGPVEPDADQDPPEQLLPAADPAGAAPHPARVDGDAEGAGLAGEPAQRRGVEVEARGGGGGVRRGVVGGGRGGGGGGGEREEGGLRGEVLEAELAEARGGGGVHPAAGDGGLGRVDGELQRQGLDDQAHEGARIHPRLSSDDANADRCREAGGAGPSDRSRRRRRKLSERERERRSTAILERERELRELLQTSQAAMDRLLKLPTCFNVSPSLTLVWSVA